MNAEKMIELINSMSSDGMDEFLEILYKTKKEKKAEAQLRLIKQELIGLTTLLESNPSMSHEDRLKECAICFRKLADLATIGYY